MVRQADTWRTTTGDGRQHGADRRTAVVVTGEPGTGKTDVAWSNRIGVGLGDVLEFHTRSDHQARDVLFIRR